MKFIVSQFLLGAAAAVTARELGLSQVDFEESIKSESVDVCPFAGQGEFVYSNIDVVIEPNADAKTETCTEKELVSIGIMINEAVEKAGLEVQESNDNVGTSFGGTCTAPVSDPVEEGEILTSVAAKFSGLRRSLQGHGFVYRGGFGCSFCPPDDDDRRSLQLLEAPADSMTEEFKEDVQPIIEDVVESYLQSNVILECLGPSPTFSLLIQPVDFWDLKADVKCIATFDEGHL